MNDLGTVKLTWRRLGVLIRALPPDSLTVRSQEEHAGQEKVNRRRRRLLAVRREREEVRRGRT